MIPDDVIHGPDLVALVAAVRAVSHDHGQDPMR